MPASTLTRTGDDGSKTTILVRFHGGSRRAFIYPQVLGAREAHELLDVILEEMRGMPFNGPVQIYRQTSKGRKVMEIVGLLPVEE